jgi:hypothetical protein
MASTYDTIKVLHPTRLELDKIKKSHGLPSYNQVITMLVERKSSKDEVVNEISKDLAKISSEVFGTLLLQFIFEMAKKVNKPLSEITVNDLLEIAKK